MVKTIKDLIEALQELPPDLAIGIASDSEGNQVNEWSGDYSLASYRTDESRGERFSDGIYDEESGLAWDSIHAVILWP